MATLTTCVALVGGALLGWRELRDSCLGVQQLGLVVCRRLPAALPCLVLQPGLR